MRYDSMPYSKKQPSDSPRAETPPVFTPFKHSFAYCSAQWCPPGVCRHASSFWSVTLQPLGADKSTIPHMKGNLHSFHMMYISMPCSRRLQRFWIWNSLSESSLVCKCKVAEGSTILFTLDLFRAKGKLARASRKFNDSSWKGFRYRSYADQKAK